MNEIKVTKKMEAAITECERKYGELEKDFFQEVIESNRHNPEYYDGCTLTCRLIQSMVILVDWEGNITKL